MNLPELVILWLFNIVLLVVLWARALRLPKD